MEPGPLGELLDGVRRWVFGPIAALAAAIIGERVGFMVGGERLGTAVTPREVDELPANLEGREADEVLGIVGYYGTERSVQPEQRTLHEVVRILPASDAG